MTLSNGRKSRPTTCRISATYWGVSETPTKEEATAVGKSVVHDDIPVELDDGVDAPLLDSDPDEKESGLDLEKVHAEELADAEEVEA